jgi:hypothetical protein
LWESKRDYVTYLMARKGRQESVPFLLRQLQSSDPFYRHNALAGLQSLGRRDYRQLFVDVHRNDRDDDVRADALICLSILFLDEHDGEILSLALEAFDNPASTVAMRLYAAAAMMYQLNLPRELGQPSWYDKQERDLQHPAIKWALKQARQLLAERKAIAAQ